MEHTVGGTPASFLESLNLYFLVYTAGGLNTTRLSPHLPLAGSSEARLLAMASVPVRQKRVLLAQQPPTSISGGGPRAALNLAAITTLCPTPGRLQIDENLIFEVDFNADMPMIRAKAEPSTLEFSPCLHHIDLNAAPPGYAIGILCRHNDRMPPFGQIGGTVAERIHGG